MENCVVCSKTFPNHKLFQRHLKTNSHKIRSTPNTLFLCDCGKAYQHKQGLSRHKKDCHKMEGIQKNYLNEMATLEARHESEKAELQKQIDDLKETKVVHHTNIENQTNIHINVYGHENLDYFHDKFIREMIKNPYESIPCIIKNLHFHRDHPENHNVKISNRKLPYASVYKGNKWELVQKKKTIEELMEKGYDMMDDRHKNVDLSERNIEKFQEFQEKYKNNDNQFRRIYQETELCVLNGSASIR